MQRDPENRLLVEGIIALGHALGMRIVAEGVELTAQAEILTDLGCDLAQGYLYGRPVSAQALRPPTATN